MAATVYEVKLKDRSGKVLTQVVKADNAASLFANADVDGGLIGGASLKAAEFLAICAAAQSLCQ